MRSIEQLDFSANATINAIGDLTIADFADGVRLTETADTDNVVELLGLAATDIDGTDFVF